MTTVSRLRRIIGLLALAAALGACSAVKLGYNTLGEVTYWWLDSYVEFSDEQTVRVREDFARLHLWHRSHELPRLAELLHRMEEVAPGDISPAQVCLFVTQARERFNSTTAQAEPAVVTLAMSLAPEQLLHLERKYASNNAEYRKKWVRTTASELADKRFRQFVERSEMIYGSLDEAQRALVRRHVEQSIYEPHRILAERQRRQQDALQTLRKLTGEPVSFGQARSLVHGYLGRSLEPPDPGRRRYQQALIDEGCRLFAGLHNSTSPDQRQGAVRRLRAYQRDLHELAAQK